MPDLTACCLEMIVLLQSVPTVWQRLKLSHCLHLIVYLLADAMTALQTLATFNSVGHCGITGNEKVDSLAKQASSSCYIGPEPSVGISVSTIYSAISSLGQ